MKQSEVEKIRSGLRQAGLSGEALLLKFQSAARQDVKLACALHGFLQHELLEEYISYLLRRIRPAVTELILADDAAGLAALECYGIYSQELTESFLDYAIANGCQESCIWLLKLKARTFGFHDKDFTLL